MWGISIETSLCDEEARYDIIPVRAEGADMPTGKTRSRCAWEAVNAPAVRCLHAMRSGCGTEIEI